MNRSETEALDRHITGDGEDMTDERHENPDVEAAKQLALGFASAWESLKALLPSQQTPAPYLELPEREKNLAIAVHNGALESVTELMTIIEKQFGLSES